VQLRFRVVQSALGNSRGKNSAGDVKTLSEVMQGVLVTVFRPVVRR
jgi:hypothetical protein